MVHPPMRSICAAALIAVGLALASGQAQAQPEPIVEPLPGEPMIEPLTENGEPIAEPADEIHPTETPNEDRLDSNAGQAAPAEPAAADDNGGGAAAGLMTEKEYAAALRDVVRSMRGKVERSILARVEAKQARRMDAIALVLSLVALGGLLMFLAPLVLRNKYPGRGKVLWKYSAISALMFFLAVNLFAGVLMVMRGAQDAAGEYTNPQIQVVKATFDLFESKAEDFAMVGPELVEPTLVGLTQDTDKPVLSIMLDNAGQLKEDIGVFVSVGSFFGKLDWLFGLLPILFVALAILLFLQAARPTLTEIVRLPERAAATDDTRGLGKAVLRATFRNVWQELKAVGCLLVMLLAISVVAGLCLSLVLQPAIEIFMSYLALSFLYVQLTEAASSFWILFALVSTILFLVLNLAVLVAATALYLGKAAKIFQLRFRNGVPMRSHRRFWLWGTGALALLFGLPVVYILIADPALAWVVTRFFSETNWALNLGLGPALFLITFGLVFWAARGVKAFKLIASYKPQSVTASVGVDAPLELGELDTATLTLTAAAAAPPAAPPVMRQQAGNWQTAQAAFQRPPTADPRLRDAPPVPTAWDPASTGTSPGSYPRVNTAAPMHLTEAETATGTEAETATGAGAAAGAETAGPQTPQRRAPLPPPSRLPPPPPKASALPLRPPSSPPPVPSAAPRKRVARGTSGPQPARPVTPSQLNSGPPPLPLSATDPNLGVSPYGDGPKR